MRIIYALFLLVFLGSCSSTKTGDGGEQAAETVTPVEYDKTFDDCFTAPDATYEQTVTGCSQGFYKILNDQFVIRISPDLTLGYGECVEWTINPSDAPSGVELIIFEKGEAGLMNICTGAFSNQAAKPINRVSRCMGRIIVGKSDPTEYMDKELPKMTFMVEQLVFFDPDTYEEIVIRNELLWKVLDKGMPE